MLRLLDLLIHPEKQTLSLGRWARREGSFEPENAVAKIQPAKFSLIEGQK
jgi:hypothetical protein